MQICLFTFISFLALFFVNFPLLNASYTNLNDQNEKPMVVVIPSYNNINWYERNLSSAICQSYKNYRIIYLNDSSTDGTCPAIEKYLISRKIDYRLIDFDQSVLDDIPKLTQKINDEINREPHFFILVNNIKRCGALENLYRGIYSCHDDEIIVTLDGDDWFADSNVLNILNNTYSSREVWLTHGFIKEYPHGGMGWSIPIPEHIIANNAYREYRCPSHLRTFYSWLFKKIKLEDLLYNGKFYSMTWDMAMMYPMIEMAGERHGFIDKVTYIYNIANAINDNKVNPQLQNDLDYIIRHKPRYSRLENRESSVE